MVIKGSTRIFLEEAAEMELGEADQFSRLLQGNILRVVLVQIEHQTGKLIVVRLEMGAAGGREVIGFKKIAISQVLWVEK